VRFWHISSLPALYGCSRRRSSISCEIYASQAVMVSPRLLCRKSFIGNTYKNRGVQVGASCGFRLLQAYGPNRQCPPQKFWAHQSKIGQLSGFSARNMHLSTARTSEIARYARLGRAVSLLSPLFLFRAFYSAVQSQLNHIEESLQRLRDYQRVSLFSGIFLGLCLYSYHVRELLACWLFFCLL